ncbi:mannitol dehydrogenase family protein [Actinopolyspora saharensis]|uniref:mannitol dehydrogenase family protein n=1 Tax=Actinopolyspora saharensis TaxID=995062 RepID=UPI003F6713BF
MGRLNLENLTAVSRRSREGIDPDELTVGIVHFGAGNFHRAHQAVYTEDAMLATGETGWAISAVTQRGPAVRDRLHDQDGLYTVVTRDESGATYRVVRSVREVLDGPSETETVLERIADPAVTVVTLTVTEHAYRLLPGTRRLDTADPGVRADASGQVPSTVVGRLVAGFRARRAAGAGPLAVVSCDNLDENGPVLRAAVRDFCALLPDGAELAEWVERNVTFPATMVDRIVPATTEEDLAEVEAELGARDEAAVVAEPFIQWVIEDDFPAARPAWEKAGALLVEDVRPYEMTKLRTLNACHSLLAYLGALADVGTIAETMSIAEFEAAARKLAEEEVAPTLPEIAGFEHDGYVDTVLRRFRNPALAHTTRQVASDGSLKIGPRLLGTVGDALRQSVAPSTAALAIAAWLRCVLVRRTDGGETLEVREPAAERIRESAGFDPQAPGSAGSAGGTASAGSEVVRPALAAAGVDEALLDDRRFLAPVEQHYDELARSGAREAARSVVAE